jgi:hypothetical protein
MYFRYAFFLIRENLVAIVLTVMTLLVLVDQVSFFSEEIELELVGYRTKSTMLGDKLIFEFARPSGEKILVNSALAGAPPTIGEKVMVTVSRSVMLNRPYYAISQDTRR